MDELSPLQHSVVYLMRSDLDLKEVRFESFGAEEKAIVRFVHHGQECVCWLRPTEDDGVIVAVKMVKGRKPRHHPRTRLTDTVEPSSAPDTAHTLVQRVRRSRGELNGKEAA